MKNLNFLLFAFYSINFNVYIISQQEETSTVEKIQYAALQGKCTIKIIKEKLTYANDPASLQEQTNIQKIAVQLKRIYDECHTIINDSNNSPEQPTLSAQEWIGKSLREIYILQQDFTTRNCFNQAINELKSVQATSSNNVHSFFQALQDCSYQDALNVSMPHLEAAIERWEQEKEKYVCDFKIFDLLVKDNVQEDQIIESLKNIHAQYNIQTDFDTFAQDIQNKRDSIQQNPAKKECLQAILQFKSIYDTTNTTKEQEILKKSFAIKYLQCKNQ